MNSATFKPDMRPNLPLRRPAAFMGIPPRIITPPFGEKKSCVSPSGPTATPGAGDAAKLDSVRKDNGPLPAEDGPSKTQLEPRSPPVVKLCHYCSQEGKFKCTRCEVTCYCSEACQREDWKAHRHVCKASAQESSPSDKTPVKSPASRGPASQESMVRASPLGQEKRVYLHELPRNKIDKGTQLQASVVELRDPGKFYIHVQSAEMTELLHRVTMALRKTYAGSQGLEYLPDHGELCAVKYSQDQNWYRGVIQSTDAIYKTASVFYIDFGNEEVVTLDRIKPLSSCIEPAPPCAVECRIAGAVAETGHWTEESCIAARQLLARGSLLVTVVDVPDGTDVWTVDIMLPATGKMLSAVLVEQGYAVVESCRPTKPADIDPILSAALENFRRSSSGGRQDSAGVQPPEPLTQGLGDRFTAMVTHVQCPSELICQKVENASVIQEMQLKLREYCTRTPASEDFRPAPGSVCCSQFTEDQQWYRATVLGYSSETQVCVGYIDFGNSEEVDLSRLRPITAELASLQMQAIPCVLAGVKPVSGGWSAEAISLLKNSVCNRFVQVEIVGERQSAALVVITDQYSDPLTSVNEMLLTSGLALADEASPPPAPAPAPAPALANGDVPQPPASNSLTSDSTPLLGEKANRIQEPSPAGPPSSTLEWCCAELPGDGEPVELAISMVLNPGEFYCHHYNAKDIRALEELSAQLQTHCQSQSPPSSTSAGDPCCAVFPVDGSWYRAMVLGLAPDKKATVYFVDYGNTCEVELSRMRAIRPEFLKLPFQAIRCWLAGVEPPQGAWGADAVQRFQALSVGRRLRAQVHSFTERGFGVELTSEGKSIAAQLLADGLAKAASQPEPPAATQGLPVDSAVIRPEGTFPVDWKTVELPRNKPFQPRVAAIVSPALFYVMREDNEDMEKVPALMVDLAAHCSSITTASPLSPQPGAACCAQLAGDKSWHRAVVLRIAGRDAEILCADYGRVEKVRLASVLPITKSHLRLPFQIVRCALSGKESFPAEWSESVLEMFGAQLRGAAQATVDRFDGTFNLLVLAPTEVTPLPLNPPKETRARAPVKPSPTPAPADPTPVEVVKSKAVMKETKTGPIKVETKSKEQPLQDVKRATTGASLPSADGKCCCNHLLQKFDQLEELIMLLMNRLGTSLPK